MAISINQIGNGMGLKLNNELYLVSEFQHVKPGKGSAFVRVKLKNLKSDAVIERTFKTSDKLDDVNLDERELQYLYASGETFHFMDHTTFEQVAVPKAELGGVESFLLENLEVTGLYCDGHVQKIVLPIFIEAKISETEPGVRGDSTRAGTKPAKIETGTTIQVPLFINRDDWVKIDTRSGAYVERVQK
jgi:elongation factor P